VLEFARHGENAWLVAPNSAPALAEGLYRLMEDSTLRRHLSDGALLTARERGWDEVYDQLLDDYGDAIESRRLIQAA
jgi:glycosyltransferase involved in cell wall biosynthesis